MSKRDVLLVIHNFSELKSLANNAKIRPSLKFLLIQYLYMYIDDARPSFLSSQPKDLKYA